MAILFVFLPAMYENSSGTKQYEIIFGLNDNTYFQELKTRKIAHDFYPEF